MSLRYSTKPPSGYKHAGTFKLLQDDQEAWNLAYLSWDWEEGPFPDPHLSVNVWKTLMFEPGTGRVDLTRSADPKRTLRGLIKGPAPQVVYKLTNLERLKETPMFMAYGQQWVDTMSQRSHLYREPHDEQLDAKLSDLSQALGVIAKLR